VDLCRVIYGTLAAYPIMTRQGFGHIVNTSSAAGLLPGPFNAPYNTSKHAVVGLSLSLRIEAADLGVKVSVVCPGFVRTSIYQTAVTVNIPDRAQSDQPSPRPAVAEANTGTAELSPDLRRGQGRSGGRN
jgi:short-subunit dehydrogenase